MGHASSCLPVKGKGRKQVIEKKFRGIKVRHGGKVLHEAGNEKDIVRGWADFSGDDGSGVTAAVRWMAGYWPCSLEISGDGRITVGLFSKHNPKAFQVNWGTHLTRQVMLDFHLGETDGEETLYALQHPPIARAPIGQYRSSGAIFNRTEIAGAEDELAVFKKYNRGMPERDDTFKHVSRRVFWTKYYSEMECYLLNYLRQGRTGQFLSAQAFNNYEIDKAFARSHGFDISKDMKWGGTGVPKGQFVQNSFDWEHQQTMGLALYYYMTGDERIREGIVDYGEYLMLHSAAKAMPDAWKSWRAWQRMVRNCAWVFDFTGDKRQLDLVHRCMDFLIDSREVQGKAVRGRNLKRGYILTCFNHPSVARGSTMNEKDKNIQSKRIGTLMGELSSQLMHLHHKHPDRLGYKRMEDFEDAMLGIAEYCWREHGLDRSTKPAEWTMHHHFKINDPGPTLANKKPGGYVYSCAAWANLIYHNFGETWMYDMDFHIPFNNPNSARKQHNHLQNQQAIYINNQRPPLRRGWKDVPGVKVTGANGSYTLSWKAVSSVKKYKIKYADKPIVPWLGFDYKKQKYDLDPEKHVPYFAANNVADEPEPLPAGQEQTWSIKGLKGGAKHFVVKYSTTYTDNWANVKGVK